jgi:hypothetical protein
MGACHLKWKHQMANKRTTPDNNTRWQSIWQPSDNLGLSPYCHLVCQLVLSSDVVIWWLHLVLPSGVVIWVVVWVVIWCCPQVLSSGVVVWRCHLCYYLGCHLICHLGCHLVLSFGVVIRVFIWCYYSGCHLASSSEIKRLPFFYWKLYSLHKLKVFLYSYREDSKRFVLSSCCIEKQ